MNFWTDLWLNEGFATYVEYLGANHTDPGFQLPQKFYLETVSRALSYDASKFTHAISAREEDVALPAGVEQIFDDVSYAKGSSLIRMVGVDARIRGVFALTRIEHERFDIHIGPNLA